MDPAAVFAEPLRDLGTEDPRLEGIFAPQGARAPIPAGVTEQFLANAPEYHRRYFDTGYWSLVLGRALDSIDARAPRTILDIGSGSGNTIIPLAERFPDARIIATDVSPQLLAILRDFLRGRADAARFALVCVDATRARFKPGVADLAVGAAILHHVFEPERVVACAFEALAPGGWAVFFEPFEAGTMVLALCYERILAQASGDERATPGMRMLERIVNDYRTRTRPRSDPIYAELDDKWMFTRTFFERIGREQGWAELRTYALHPSADELRKQAIVQLRLGAGLGPEALPGWAWSIIDATDAGISADLREELGQEAAILLRKPPRKGALGRLLPGFHAGR